jgi:hypothetical protein
VFRIRPNTQLRRLELGLLDNERVRIRPNSQFPSSELDLPGHRGDGTGPTNNFTGSEIDLLINKVGNTPRMVQNWSYNGSSVYSSLLICSPI